MRQEIMETIQKKFITQYTQSGEIYGSYVYAKNIQRAKALCNYRNIGEFVIGELVIDESYDFSKYLPKKVTELLHEACFLSFICLKSGIISVEEILGDKGIVHELSHFISQNEKKRPFDSLKSQIEHLRRLTPGYEPV